MRVIQYCSLGIIILVLCFFKDDILFLFDDNSDELIAVLAEPYSDIKTGHQLDWINNYSENEKNKDIEHYYESYLINVIIGCTTLVNLKYNSTHYGKRLLLYI